MALPLLLSIVYALSCLGKLRSPASLERYLDPLARGRSRLLARLVLLTESMLVVALAASSAIEPVRPWAGGASAAFLVLASAFHAVLIGQGRPARCHCFGDLPSTRRQVDAAWRPALFALRNGVLVAASAAVAGLAGAAIVASGVVALAIAAGLIASIAGERSNMRREQHPLTTVLAPEFLHLQAHTCWVNGHPRAF
jgi:hypothetical protein